MVSFLANPSVHLWYRKTLASASNRRKKSSSFPERAMQYARDVRNARNLNLKSSQPISAHHMTRVTNDIQLCSCVSRTGPVAHTLLKCSIGTFLIISPDNFERIQEETQEHAEN